MKPIRILLADDHTLLRMGLTTLIAEEDDMEIVGEADNGESAVQLAQELNPDIVIMDLMMPRMNGSEATKAIVRTTPTTRILILTTFGTSAELVEAIRNGAAGVLMKDTATSELVSSVRTLVAGGTVIPEELRRQAAADTSAEQLTTRQRAILDSVTRGYSNPTIARQLGISEIGVKKHLQAIFLKVGASNRAEAVAIALRKQLLKA